MWGRHEVEAGYFVDYYCRQKENTKIWKDPCDGHAVACLSSPFKRISVGDWVAQQPPAITALGSIVAFTLRPPFLQAGHSRWLSMAVVLDLGQSWHKCESSHRHALGRSFLSISLTKGFWNFTLVWGSFNPILFPFFLHKCLTCTVVWKCFLFTLAFFVFTLLRHFS